MFDDHKFFSQTKVTSFAGIVAEASSCNDRPFNIKVNRVVLRVAVNHVCFLLVP